MVCIDASEWCRSGDYVPTRFAAQTDAVNLLAGAKTQAHPENTVGVLSMSGKTPRVLVTPTPDLGKVLNCMNGLDVEGDSNISASLQIAQLALKHRQNKNQRQRIVIFVGSPVAEDKARGGCAGIARKGVQERGGCVESTEAGSRRRCARGAVLAGACVWRPAAAAPPLPASAMLYGPTSRFLLRMCVLLHKHLGRGVALRRRRSGDDPERAPHHITAGQAGQDC